LKDLYLAYFRKIGTIWDLFRFSVLEVADQ